MTFKYIRLPPSTIFDSSCTLYGAVRELTFVKPIPSAKYAPVAIHIDPPVQNLVDNLEHLSGVGLVAKQDISVENRRITAATGTSKNIAVGPVRLVANSVSDDVIGPIISIK